MLETPAEKEFNTSSLYEDDVRPPYKPWKIRNDYPPTSTERPNWLDIDFTNCEASARAYCDAIKNYVLAGNVEHNFNVHENKIRDWYHPVWLHYGPNGREPINGLKYAGPMDKKFISETQNRILQCWLCSYFNAPAATAMSKIWADPNKPKWDKNNQVKLPIGSIIFENVFLDAAEDQIYTLKGAPTADALIAESDAEGNHDPAIRKKTPDRLRLIQTDFAARDPRFPQHGWVFGTFVFDGTKEEPSANPWDDLIPVGLEWGNDPTLTQEAHNDGKLSKECWVNGHALDLFHSLRADRPWLGWHGRLDGLVDDFTSTCTSCHATAQLTPDGKRDTYTPWIQPKPNKIPNGDGKPGIYVEAVPGVTETWFRNVPAGEPFTKDHLSADYNRHILFGYENYLDWLEKSNAGN